MRVAAFRLSTLFRPLLLVLLSLSFLEAQTNNCSANCEDSRTFRVVVFFNGGGTIWLKLNTQTGQLWSLQFSNSADLTTIQQVPLNTSPAAEATVNGRFMLNVMNGEAILLDKDQGTVWLISLKGQIGSNVNPLTVTYQQIPNAP
jgi:hypothetical protein